MPVRNLRAGQSLAVASCLIFSLEMPQFNNIAAGAFVARKKFVRGI
jgi:hypothetical protein